MDTLLAITIILLDAGQNVLLALSYRVYVEQMRRAETERDPWLRWADGEGRPVLRDFERGTDGRM